jgi:hypothetical protein
VLAASNSNREAMSITSRLDETTSNKEGDTIEAGTVAWRRADRWPTHLGSTSKKSTSSSRTLSGCLKRYVERSLVLLSGPSC